MYPLHLTTDSTIPLAQSASGQDSHGWNNKSAIWLSRSVSSPRQLVKATLQVLCGMWPKSQSQTQSNWLLEAHQEVLMLDWIALVPSTMQLLLLMVCSAHSQPTARGPPHAQAVLQARESFFFNGGVTEAAAWGWLYPWIQQVLSLKDQPFLCQESLQPLWTASPFMDSGVLEPPMAS